MAKLTVRDLMTEQVYTVTPKDDLDTVHELMETHHIRHLPVVDRRGDLLGLVCQCDLVRHALFAGEAVPLSSQHLLLQSRKVGDIMEEEVDTIEPDEEAGEAGKVMLENNLGCLPVVEGTRLVGILTEADFVRYVVIHDAVEEQQVA